MKKAINITQEVLSKNPHLGSLGIKVFTEVIFQVDLMALKM